MLVTFFILCFWLCSAVVSSRLCYSHVLTEHPRTKPLPAIPLLPVVVVVPVAAVVVEIEFLHIRRDLVVLWFLWSSLA